MFRFIGSTFVFVLKALLTASLIASLQMAQAESPPPSKPPLPLDLAAENGELIIPHATKPAHQIGLIEVELASYKTIKNAKHGLNTLTKALVSESFDVRLYVKASKLASGRNIFRVVSAPIALETARDVCTFFWNHHYACIIKASSSF